MDAPRIPSRGVPGGLRAARTASSSSRCPGAEDQAGLAATYSSALRGERSARAAPASSPVTSTVTRPSPKRVISASCSRQQLRDPVRRAQRLDVLEGRALRQAIPGGAGALRAAGAQGSARR